MVLECNNIRYAHEAGHTDICYGSDNKSILTCGADGNVRIFDGSDDDDPSADLVSEATLAVACTKDLFLVATDSNYVQTFTFPERKRDKIIFRFSAPVTNIAVSSSGKLIAACSCDMEIQVLDTETNKITTFTGHTAPVLGVSLDPLDNFLVSSSCDGSIKIWDISTSSLVKTFPEFLPYKNDFFKTICLGRSAWKSFSGSFLAVPKDLEVHLYKRYSWELAFKLTSNNIEKALSAVLFSPCGNYLAGASIAGNIIIWDIKNKTEVCNYKDSKKVGICGIAWHPDGSEISFTDRLGRFGVLSGVNEEISKSIALGQEVERSEMTEDDIVDNFGEEINTNDLFEEDEDDDNCISLEKIKASYKNESDNETPASPASAESVGRSKTVVESVMKLQNAQAPFQPSSTPSHFEPRCLCFNSVGIVRYYESDKTVDVQFHDTMFHHALFLRSFGVCTMAALSVNVLCLAAPSIDSISSKLSCIPLSSWSGSKEWTVHMPENEDILALATNGNWVAAATSANHLRIFTNAGTQKQIVSLPGPIVCMSGFEQKILLVCHLGMGLMENQNLAYTMYHVSNFQIKAMNSFQPLPLYPKSVLKWVGFSDEGTPCTFDSEGIVRVLAHDSLHWEVVCDTRNQRKSSSDHYFIVGLSERYQNIRCVLCRNSYYPMIITIPTVLEIPLKMPLCELDSEKSIQEEIFWRLMFSLFTLQKSKEEFHQEISDFEQTLKQTSLKLFAEACRNSEDMRALDVASFMSSRPLEVAVKYASKAGKIYLAEKLHGLNPLEWKDQCIETENDRWNNQEMENNFEENDTIIEDSQQKLIEIEKSSKKEDRSLNAQEESTESQEILAHTLVNPFKKTKSFQKDGPKGLKFFDTLPKELPKLNKPPAISKPLKLKSSNINKSKKNEPKVQKPTFVQWFSTKKAALTEEYPNISASELTKLGMKIYKETMSGPVSEDNSISEQSDCGAFESKKRGLDDESEFENKKFRTINDIL